MRATVFFCFGGNSSGGKFKKDERSPAFEVPALSGFLFVLASCTLRTIDPSEALLVSCTDLYSPYFNSKTPLLRLSRSLTLPFTPSLPSADLHGHGPEGSSAHDATELWTSSEAA